MLKKKWSFLEQLKKLNKHENNFDIISDTFHGFM